MAKLFKRGSIWHGYVRKRGGGVRRITTLCTDKRAAEVVLAQLEREAVDPAYAAANKTTTQTVLDNYYASRQRLGRAAGSLHHVRVKAGQLLRLMPTRAADVSHPGGERYIDARLADGVRRTTIKKELRVWKAALRLAKKNGLWNGDPEAVVPQLDDDYVPGSRVLTPLELVGLACVLPPRRMALVAFSVAVGSDPSAAFRATAADVAEDASHVQVHGTKRKSRERPVPLPFEGQRALVRWALARAPATGLLFRPWGNIRRDLHAACAKLGIPGCSPNDLRRTYGTWLREAGVEPQLIGAAMGHTDSRMAERVYGKLTPDALAKLLDIRVSAAGVATLTREASRSLTMADAPLEVSASGVRLVCGSGDVSAHVEASGASASGDEDDENSAETDVFAGARGRNRTADTGIFNPPSETRSAAEFSGDGEQSVGSRAIGVLSFDGAAVAIRAAMAAVYGGRAPAEVAT